MATPLVALQRCFGRKLVFPQARMQENRGWAALAIFAFACVLMGASALHAQRAPKRKKKIPPMEMVNLTAQDNFPIRAMWYAGTLQKKSIPFIMLHDYDGRASQFSRMASFLQDLGHAVICPDLRGHGASVAGRLDKPDNLRRAHFQRMYFDVEACKQFLKEKNNKEELNLEMLTVIGAGMGATLALEWAMKDWQWQDLGNIRQGRDVKALVLLSPERSTKGINANRALAFPIIRDKMPILIAVGADNDKALNEAERIYTSLKRKRTIPKPENQQEVKEKQDLFFFRYPIKNQGVDLLHPQTGLYRNIGMFVQWRLIDKADQFPWSERKSAP